MKTPEPDDLIAYLYDEADDPTRAAVDEHLDSCDATRGKVESWRSTMDLLDKWVVDDKPADAGMFWSRTLPVLKLAALVAFLLGLGFLFGQHWTGRPGSDQVADAKSGPPMDEAAVEARVADRLEQELDDWDRRQREMERNLILASGAMTHRQVQEYVGQALRHLNSNAARNDTLALFLPPGEQQAYQRKRAAWDTVASGVVRETRRSAEFTQQIIERARARARRSAH